jgi:phosphatidylglycerol:prolipoprotein diacylglycerol transferase
MQQVLFRIPFPGLADGLPIYGYGMMLFLAFVACTWLASRLARREGIAVEHVQDLAIYLFIGGVIGSRVWFFFEEKLAGRPADWSHFLYIWEGGLVFYGGMAGGAIAFVVAYYAIIKKHHLSTLKLADVIAPCAALGLCLGRVGCLLNGCCYGVVACENCPKLEFPFSGMPRQQLVREGSQTAAGFTTPFGLAVGTVGSVEPGSAADRAGLRPGDVIRKVDGRDIDSEVDLWEALSPEERLRGKNDLTLSVERGKDTKDTLDLTFSPKTLGLHPTQLYESISTALLLFLLLAYYPFRRHDGELFALFLMLYPLHRFLDEMLRADNPPVALGLTLSQSGSLLLFAVGLVFFLWLRRLPAQYQPALA